MLATLESSSVEVSMAECFDVNHTAPTHRLAWFGTCREPNNLPQTCSGLCLDRFSTTLRTSSNLSGHLPALTMMLEPFSLLLQFSSCLHPDLGNPSPFTSLATKTTNPISSNTLPNTKTHHEFLAVGAFPLITTLCGGRVGRCCKATLHSGGFDLGLCRLLLSDIGKRIGCLPIVVRGLAVRVF